MGIAIKEGVLKVGTPLCVEHRGHVDPKTGMQAYLDIGRVMSMEVRILCIYIHLYTHIERESERERDVCIGR